MISFSIETLPDLTDRQLNNLRLFETLIILIFTAEYLLRIAVSEKKLKYIFSFFGIIDLISIVPFYLALGFDLRALRILRFVRLLRLLKLLRYSAALKRFISAFHYAKEELAIFLIASTLLLYLAAVGIYHFEHTVQPEKFSSVFSCLWWSVITLTTVGYGDIYPITIGGRIFTFFVLMLGLGVVAVPTGIIATALSEVRRKEEHANHD